MVINGVIIPLGNFILIRTGLIRTDLLGVPKNLWYHNINNVGNVPSVL